MRIVQVAPRYHPRTGGVETHVRAIAERLVDRGHDVLVFTADASRSARRHETVDGVEVRRHRGASPGGNFHVAPGIWRSVRATEADVVHAHNYHSLPVLFAALGVTGERFVVTPHYHGGSASRWRDLLLAGYRPVGRWAMGRADAVVAVSEWEQERLRGDLGVRATVVPNGIDTERFATATPATRPRPYLLCVGRLVEYKGIEQAINALATVSGYDLLVAGDGPWRTRLRDAAEDLGVEDRVEFLGYVDEDRLPELYAGAEVFLNLSTQEAYGMTVAESLAAGTPCVVLESGALVDWTDRRAVVGVDDSDPETVAKAIGPATGLTPHGALPSWNVVVDRLVDVYTDEGR